MSRMNPSFVLKLCFLTALASFFTIYFFSSCKSDKKEIQVAGLPDSVDFNFHIKPILSDRCFKCHGPDTRAREGNFRCDTEAGAFAALDSLGKRHAIISADLDESVLYQRIATTNKEEVMPPIKSNLALSNYEIALIGKWIEQGAKWKKHWSFLPPKNTSIPVVKNKSWPKNEIDYFVLNRMEQKGLGPSPEASKETLLRRLSFDLTGLPPTLPEIDSFLADTSPKAYEKTVDRLLASPHYGERMSVDWLDLARYSDSHGYQDDGFRNSWPWRDWVIKAYNQNLSYDKFITWQLAGDLLPQPTKDQLIATSFNRNHPQSQEGGIVDEEYRIEYVADRTNTFSKAFLALTMECSRCHDHKYDPITQKDYYSLFAFFNNNKESGEIPYSGEASPTIILTSEDAEAQLKFIKDKMTPLKSGLKSEQYQASFEKWLNSAINNPDKFSNNNNGLIGWFKFEEPQKADVFKNEIKNKLAGFLTGDLDKRPLAVEGKVGNGRKFIGDAGIGLGAEMNFDRHQPFSVGLWVNLLNAGEKGTIFAKDNGEFEGFRGYRCLLNADGTLQVNLNYVWPANSIDLQTIDKINTKTWQHIMLTYDGTSKAEGVKIFIDGKEARRKVITDNLHKSLLHGEKGANWSKVPFLIGKDFRGSMENIIVDELRAYTRQLADLEVQELSGKSGAIADIIKNHQRSVAQKQLLFEYYLLNFDKEYSSNLAKLTKLRDEENKIITDQPELMIMKEREEVRPSYILDRGVYDSPKQRVFPSTPEHLNPFSKNLPKNRLGLAQWLVDPKNPITSRVMVNRFWAMCFGKGIVKTTDDFGNQGELPTHPDLLDWMAINYMKSGWNTKAFMKKIVMSATYRQSSVPTKQSKEKDPDNILLSRGPSFRLSAEMVRDNALAASGLLVKKIGGKSVYPYQPAGLWEALATRNSTHYEQGHGEDLYRRSMYTVWKRSSPPPSMMNFDSPDRYFCVVRRQKTSTPLQSLVLMNDPQYFEASRVLGERMMKEGGESIDSRIVLAFKSLTSRAPRNEEVILLKKLYNEELEDLKKSPEKTEELLSTGEYKRDKKLNSTELAACTIVASTVMNFEEAVMKR